MTVSNTISCTRQQKGPSRLMRPILSYFRQPHCINPVVKIPDSLKQLWLWQLWLLWRSCPRALFLWCLKTILPFSFKFICYQIISIFFFHSKHYPLA